MVAPLVEALLLRLVRGRTRAAAAPHPTRLVSRPHPVDSVAQVADRTSLLLLRPRASVEVLTQGALVLPGLLGRDAATYVVVSHDPVGVWLRIGPFETQDGRVVQQVELRLDVSLTDSPSGLLELVEDSRGDAATALDELGDVVLDRLGREVSARTTDVVRRRSLADLTGLSLGVLLHAALPTTFLEGLVSRSGLEVVDVDWPTEGRGWPAALVPAPGVVPGPAAGSA